IFGWERIEVVLECDVVDRHHQQPALRIESAAGPIHAACHARVLQRTTDARWSKDALVAQPAEFLFARLEVLRRHVPQVGLGELLRYERRRLKRKRLRGPRALVWDIRRRDRMLL